MPDAPARPERPRGDPWAAMPDDQPPERDGEPARFLTARYILGLAAIAVFAIASTYLVGQALSSQEGDARALSAANHLATLSLQIRGAAESLTPTEQIETLAMLDDVSMQLRSAYLGLQFGDDTLGLEPTASEELLGMFESVDPSFFSMLSNVETVLTSDSPAEQNAELAELISQAELFRHGVESIAFQVQREAEARVENAKKAQLLLLEGILLLVLFEAVFLFRPVANRIRAGWHEREQTHAEERERDREQLNYLAQFDPLTGLANRVLLRDRLEHAIARARRDGTLVSVMFIDLDDFKAVNDQFGHDIGDQLLKQVSRRLTDAVRESDTVARLGGDEFMIILEGGIRPEGAGHVADKIIESLDKPFLLLDRKLYVTGSVGIVVYPLDGDRIDGLLRDADLAMYSAKEAGKNNYQFFTPELRAKTSKRLELLDDLRGALTTDDELWLAYQPKISVDTGRIIGVEALIRWNHPELGTVQPGQFIPIAEETDLIIPLGDWVIREACHQAREWQDAGLTELAVSVNVAARQFRHGDLVASVSAALRESGVRPSQIEIELTEGTLIEDTEVARRTLERLKDMGVKISIDDFGTGYSSMSYLKRFPLDYLKIDRSFINDIQADPEGTAIPTAIIRLAHSLRLEVIAEGVETTEQMSILRDLGCDIVQGFLFSGPLPASELEEIARGVTPVIA